MEGHKHLHIGPFSPPKPRFLLPAFPSLLRTTLYSYDLYVLITSTDHELLRIIFFT